MAPSIADIVRTNKENNNSKHTINDPFTNLVEEIRSCLGQEAGIDTSNEHLEELILAMKSYISNELHWERYALGDKSRAYTRNLVDDVNGNANLLVLVWNPLKSSPVHDHSNAHCVMKILKGRLEEIQYDWPEGAKPMRPCPATQEDLDPHPTHCAQTLKVRKKTVYGRDEVTYISDTIGLHRIGNPDPNEVAISLHLYTPPWASKYGCQIFNEKTGQSHRVTQVCLVSSICMFC